MNLKRVSQFSRVVSVAAWFGLFSVALAERLPVKQYTIADGLAQGRCGLCIRTRRAFSGWRPVMG